ncbi:MAG: hypothetical protein LQ340_003297 [Diploschistes diacapsis]|nr:MAG: hypothetical protein LQ340_003297 [Diploschistes diacapsis]
MRFQPSATGLLAIYLASLISAAPLPDNGNTPLRTDEPPSTGARDVTNRNADPNAKAGQDLPRSPAPNVIVHAYDAAAKRAAIANPGQDLPRSPAPNVIVHAFGGQY